LEDNKDLKFYWLPCEVYDDAINDLQENLKKDLEDIISMMFEKSDN